MLLAGLVITHYTSGQHSRFVVLQNMDRLFIVIQYIRTILLHLFSFALLVGRLTP